LNDTRAKRPPLGLAVYCVVLVIWLAGLYLPLFFGGFPHPIDTLDFSYYYAAARIGLEHGWSHIYDLDLQRQVFYQLHPASDLFDWRRYFASPPPVAWLVAPFTVLSMVPAFWTFTSLSAVALIVCGWLAAPGRGLAKLALFLSAACTYPVLIAIQTGQVTPLMAAATLLAWWLARRGMQMAAGIALVVIVFKPQVEFLVPVVLIIAGQRRLFVTWCVGAAALAAVSVATLGGHGLDSLGGVLGAEQNRSEHLAWTLAEFVGPGPLAVAAELGCAALALLAAWRSRRSLELAMVAGILGSLLASSYHNPSDYALLAPAAWLYIRAGIPIWHWAWLALGLLATYVAAQFGPYLLLAFTLGWLGLVVVYSGRTNEPVRVSAFAG
jgi:Glycosyltransferase family 87